MRREWSDSKQQLDSELADTGQASIFRRDFLDDVGAIESLNTGLMQTAVQDAAGRLDSGALVFATAAVALAAVAGVIIGLFL